MSPEYINYYENKENKTITCVIDNCKYDAIEQVISHIDGEATYLQWNNSNMPNKFVGIATCSDEDTYDYNIGADLAFNRAYAKYIASLKKHTIKMADDMIARISRSKEACINRADKLIDCNRVELYKIIDRYTNGCVTQNGLENESK
jgi:hypothetical protein